MPITHTLTHRKDVDLLNPFLSSLIIVLFFFYIDEGFYDFRWMADPGDWFVFGIYLVIFFPVQFLLARYLFGRFNTVTRMILMLLVAVPLTIGIFFWITL